MRRNVYMSFSDSHYKDIMFDVNKICVQRESHPDVVIPYLIDKGYDVLLSVINKGQIMKLNLERDNGRKIHKKYVTLDHDTYDKHCDLQCILCPILGYDVPEIALVRAGLLLGIEQHIFHNG